MIHITHPMSFLISYHCLCFIFYMVVGINMVMFQLEMNFGHHKLIFISFTNFTFKQYPTTITMDIPKNPKPKKENKMGGYDGISCMKHHFKSMEIDNIFYFLFPNFFVALLHPISAIPCHLHLFLHTHQVVWMKVCKSSTFFMHLWALCEMFPMP